jgi:hypothetical protein
MKSFLSLLLIATSIIAANAQAKKTAAVYGVNLIQNPGAEVPVVGKTILNWKPITLMEGWDFLCDSYGHTAGEWDYNCDEKCGLPPKAGSHYFRMPVDNDNPHIGLSQEINLAAIADTLQKRKITFTLSGYMTGFVCERPECSKGRLSIRFYDKSNTTISTYDFPKDNAAFTKFANEADHRMMQFEPVSVENEVPQNAVKAIVQMEGISKHCCNGSYVFFDNLSLAVKKGEVRTQ